MLSARPHGRAFFVFYPHHMLRIALPNKGRLAGEARELFADAGLEVRSGSSRSLTASLGGEFEAIFVRAQDIPGLVADGAADAGVTGWDLVVESGCELMDALDLEFGKCRIVIAVREDREIRSPADIPDGARVATVFPNITRDYFKRRAQNVVIVPISGAVEIAPHLGLADVIVDLTSSGSTLRMNRLRAVETVMESSARLITSAAPADDKAEILSELITALDSVLRARGKRYLMANVPRNRLDDVKKILPGLNGPTVVDILNGGLMVAAHAVVPAAAVYRTIAALRKIGAEGILVTRIERLMP